MKYKVVTDFAIKTSEGVQTINGGGIISLPADKAAPLLRAGKITEMPPRPSDLYERDRLFHEYAGRLSLYPLSPEEIPEPLWTMLKESSRRFDAAWMTGSMDAFVSALEEVEGWHIRAYYDIKSERQRSID